MTPTRLAPALALLLTALAAATAAFADPAPPSPSPAPPYHTGVDTNYALDMAQRGRTWSDAAGPVDPFTHLAAAGADAIRIRLWVGDQGMNRLDYALATAKRAQAVGLRPYLVLFLSEDWADLVKQPVPAAWAALPLEQRAAAVEQYAELVTRRFADAGVNANLYEIGNEIDFGVCGEFEEEWMRRVSLEYMRQRVWPRMAPILLAAQRGVLKADPDARFVIHLAQWNNMDYCITMWRWLRDAGVRIDYLGLSYFPSSAEKPEQRTLAYMLEHTRRAADALDRPVLICETGYPSTPEFGGHFAAWNHAASGYPLDPDGQRRWLADLLRVTRGDPRFAGVYYWSPEWYDGGLWDAFALFDAAGRARPALGAFAPTATDEPAAPPSR